MIRLWRDKEIERRMLAVKSLQTNARRLGRSVLDGDHKDVAGNRLDDGCGAHALRQFAKTKGARRCGTRKSERFSRTIGMVRSQHEEPSYSLPT
jgi:hypothetical protein